MGNLIFISTTNKQTDERECVGVYSERGRQGTLSF